MDERPSFYPKYLAKQYVHEKRQNDMGKREVSPTKNDETASQFMTHKRQLFAPKMTSSTVNLPARKKATSVSCEPQRNLSKALSGLPDSFIDAMRRLFNLLDLQHCGKVKYEDIAARWSLSEHSDSRLPPGVLNSLERLATQDGYLTFERFCAGIKIAILRHEAAEKRKNSDATQNGSCDSGVSSAATSYHDGNEITTSVSGPHSSGVTCHTTSQCQMESHQTQLASETERPPVAYQSPISPIRNRKPPLEDRHGKTAFDNSPLSRTASLPNLPGSLKAVQIFNQEETHAQCQQKIGNDVERLSNLSPVVSEPWGNKDHGHEIPSREGPPKPPRNPFRMSGHFSRGSTNSLPAHCHPYPNISSYINPEAPIHFIWKEPPPEMRVPSAASYSNQASDQLRNGRSNFSIVIDENTNFNQPDIVVLQKSSEKIASQQRKSFAQEGIDNSMSRHIKLLEEERQVVEEALATIERARTCYLQRLNHVDHNLQICRSNQNEAHWEAAQERLMFELKSIRELDQRLHHLIKIGKQQKQEAPPVVLRPVSHQEQMLSPSSERRIKRLQEQNRLLTEEVGKKSQIITELEDEKRLLIRQLFQQSASISGSTDTIKSSSSFKQPLKQINSVTNRIPPLIKPAIPSNTRVSLDCKKNIENIF